MLKIWEPDNFRRTLAGLCCFAAPATLLLTLLVHPGEGPAGWCRPSPPSLAGSRPRRC